MKTQEWKYYDKTTWPERGPWDNEPDKKQWQDEATGLPCLAVRNRHGNWCGYVGVTEEHPFFGVSYSRCANTPKCENGHCDHSPESIIEVHGGITYSDFCDPAGPDGTDHPTICHKDDPEKRTYWFGFDCAHCFDYTPCIDAWRMKFETDWAKAPPGYDRHQYGTYRDLAYVQEECRRMAEQLKEKA